MDIQVDPTNPTTRLDSHGDLEHRMKTSFIMHESQSKSNDKFAENKRLSLSRTLHGHKHSMHTINNKQSLERLSQPFVIQNKLSIKEQEQKYKTKLATRRSYSLTGKLLPSREIKMRRESTSKSKSPIREKENTDREFN